MLQTLKQFYCDACGRLITHPEHAWVEWLHTDNPLTKEMEFHSYKLVHHIEGSPFTDLDGCYHYKYRTNSNICHWQDFTNDYILYPQARDIREYTEIMRRLTVPYYEEARYYIQQAAPNLDYYHYLNPQLPNSRFFEEIVMRYRE